jgi:hypothetical protein
MQADLSLTTVFNKPKASRVAPPALGQAQETALQTTMLSYLRAALMALATATAARTNRQRRPLPRVGIVDRHHERRVAL